MSIRPIRLVGSVYLAVLMNLEGLHIGHESTPEFVLSSNALKLQCWWAGREGCLRAYIAGDTTPKYCSNRAPPCNVETGAITHAECQPADCLTSLLLPSQIRESVPHWSFEIRVVLGSEKVLPSGHRLKPEIDEWTARLPALSRSIGRSRRHQAQGKARVFDGGGEEGKREGEGEVVNLNEGLQASKQAEAHGRATCPSQIRMMPGRGKEGDLEWQREHRHISRTSMGRAAGQSSRGLHLLPAKVESGASHPCTWDLTISQQQRGMRVVDNVQKV
ncbi:hypothetical protein FA13DRAFT_1709879 [Coprinellus micaceus]|uniref:Uncharacterized protein n=1 Tax=Coprinellus micaceus TaxID=71717 RepID=A0A4Y7TA16_COPMI|nr:hypothetical protein FA13DRAFT_1709879 [Coprinellus micaceus]